MKRLLVAMVVLTGATCTSNRYRCSLEGEAQRGRESYERECTIPFQIDRQYIGAFAAESADAQEVVAISQQNGFLASGPFFGNFWLLRSQKKAASLRSLSSKVATLAQTQSKMFTRLGLIIPTKDHKVGGLITDEFVAIVDERVPDGEHSPFHRENEVQVVRSLRGMPNALILRARSGSPYDALRLAAKYGTVFAKCAHPNVLWWLKTAEQIPNDPHFLRMQWPHRYLTGTVDWPSEPGFSNADAFTAHAWDFTMGHPGMVIAVLDWGLFVFDDGEHGPHPDLAPNLFSNPAELANGLDDDSNGFVDDLHGWDFSYNDNNPRPYDPEHCPLCVPESHGTAVAGIAGARGNNSVGVAGACPNCRLLPLKIYPSVDEAGLAEAFLYANTMGAKIINASFSLDPEYEVSCTLAEAIRTVAQHDSLILFAGGSEESSGWCRKSFPSLTDVMAISSSTNWNQKNNQSAFGNCIDLLAPSDRGQVPFVGTLEVATTDLQGNDGYNAEGGGTFCLWDDRRPPLGGNPEIHPAQPRCPPQITPDRPCAVSEPEEAPDGRDYTYCFGGTSAAAPLVAGIACIVRSIAPSLTPAQVQKLLQDTADKIEPRAAGYSPNIGFSNPSSGVATHAWGKINALEAVRIVMPRDHLRGGGVDLFVRDNSLDWGNTTALQAEISQFMSNSVSEDIKIDGPPFQTPPISSIDFGNIENENPVPGTPDSPVVNKAYVRVWNRGPISARNVSVSLYWSELFGMSAPPLPDDFWTAFPLDPPDLRGWHKIGSQTVPEIVYSAASSAQCPARDTPTCVAVGGESLVDRAQIVTFQFLVDVPLSHAPSMSYLLIVDSSDDPISSLTKTLFSAEAISSDNNVTQLNQIVLVGVPPILFEFPILISNSLDERITVALRNEKNHDWRVQLEGGRLNQEFVLRPQQSFPVKVHLTIPRSSQYRALTLIQERTDGASPKVLGALRFLAPPGNR